jgi:hypothetical protein
MAQMRTREKFHRQKSLQAEWIVVQRVIQGVGEKFGRVRDAIQPYFLPALFREVIVNDDPMQKLASLPTKATGLALPDPMVTSQPNLRASEVTNSHLIQVMRGAGIFAWQTTMPPPG